MAYVIPPPPAKTGKSQKGVFDAYILSKHDPAFKNYSQGIYRAATDYGIDPTYFASLLWSEGFEAAKQRGVDVSTVTSSAGAVGPGQIMPLHIGSALPWAPGRTLTAADLANPATNIRFAAYYFGTKLAAAGGNYDQAYRGQGGYNQGGPQIFQDVPKTYVPTSTAQSPTDVAARGAETTAAKVDLYDRWAVLGADGRVKFVKITNTAAPPKNVLHYGPTPLTQTQFLTTWKQNYADTFFSYTGRQASGKEIASILSNAPSLYTLANTLATTKSFTTSPTYKAHAPGIIAIAKQDFGDDWKVDKSLVAQAISQNWDQATLEENLKQRPEYENGPTFKTTLAQMDNTYQQIYGASTDPATQQLIDHVARQGWSTDEFAAYLRTQPAYRGSQEFKSKALSFAQQLGLITGQTPTLTADQAMLGGAPPAPTATPAPPLPPPAVTVPPGHGSGAVPYIRPTRSATGGPA